MNWRLALMLVPAVLLTGCELEQGVSRGIEPVVVTEANFDQVVLGSSKPVMVDCWADWCGWCKVLKPTVHELAADYEGRAVVAQLDTDANREIARRYGVEALPTLLFFKDGQLVDKVEGAKGKAELSSRLAALLDNSTAGGAE